MIAENMEVSIDTVRAHIKKIYEKLRVHSMNEPVAKAIKQRIV
jgi:DNA-binding CsgD family transcriptional regulator